MPERLLNACHCNFYLDIATAYVTEKDFDRMLDAKSPYVLAVETTFEGAFFYVPILAGLEDEKELLLDLERHGYSEYLQNIFIVAAHSSIHLIRFNLDGGDAFDLPKPNEVN